MKITYHELMWEIPWAVIQRMLIDAPTYKSKKNKEADSEKGKMLSHEGLMKQLMNYHGTLER
ncbi:hypothetical protein [Dyadobacter bucti]|uniref:hypothetical protein n=1 Tax=Dyadobacter bucti TaxID=2572203 RepID=UPI001108D324|nr:hypothetical protein [Dyadobacter bucti]